MLQFSEIKIFKYLFLSMLCPSLLITLQLRAQQFSVYPTTAKIIKETTITVKIDNWNCSQMQVRTDNGKLRKVADCKYILIPLRVGSANISVSKVMSDGAIIDLGSKKITTVGQQTEIINANTSDNIKLKNDEPVFDVRFANKQNNEEIWKEIFLKSNSLSLHCSDEKLIAKSSIVAYDIIILEGDISVYTKQIFNNKISYDIVDFIFKSKANLKVLFANVIIKNNGKLINVPNLILNIKK